MSRSPAVRMRPGEAADVPFITEIESRPDYRPFINQWSADRHRAALADPDHRYLIFEDSGGACGYTILGGVTSTNASIVLTRIALARTGEGLGEACCRLLMAEVFDRLGAHRFHLDLFEANTRAERLYLSLGFQPEGVAREAERRGDRFLSLKLMSILEPDYRANLRRGD
jgi:RimJ/RimL family protein N-acetyltransferase